MGELSIVQRRALEAIARQGGSAIAEGGGWWKGDDGNRLLIEPPDRSIKTSVGTTTIYALEDRGLLKRDGRFVVHLDTRRITEAGRIAVGEADERKTNA